MNGRSARSDGEPRRDAASRARHGASPGCLRRRCVVQPGQAAARRRAISALPTSTTSTAPAADAA